MQQRLTDEQWRLVLSLSELAADLPPQARREFIAASGAPPEVTAQAFLLISDFGPQAEAPDRVGSSVGRFLIEEYCGSGGVGDVYRALDTELDRTVALKFLRPTALDHAGAVDRFIREARTVSALNHPNIVTVHEVLRSGDSLAIVMEFVEGTPLRAISGRDLPLRQIIELGRQIALALAAAHGRGIVHRDIKPENAILRPDGSVKVLDFGLAISVSTHYDGDAGISASHLFAGTWRYMSPEQSRGEPVTAATDIFSLGLVLCELTFGCAYNDSPSPSRSTKDAFGPTSPAVPQTEKVPRRLRPLIRSMLAEIPTQRPSAAAVSRELAAIEQLTLSRSKRLKVLALFSLATICVGLLFHFLSKDKVPGTLLASAISVEPGSKYSLAFSPAGDRIAYAWDREGKPRQIYLQEIDAASGTASPPVRLTLSPLAEDLPAWSPDGRTIAFTRIREGAHWDLILRDVSTGRETITTTFAGRSLNWTKDGQWLVGASGLYLNHSVVLISARDGRQRHLTTTTGILDDQTPAPTPDRRHVIFSRFFGDSRSQLATVLLDSEGLAPTFLSWPDFQARLLRNPVFSSDGSDLFFIAEKSSIRQLYRSHNGQTPVLLASLGEQIDDVSIPARRNRMAFLRSLDDTNIWQLRLKAGADAPAGQFTRIISSLRDEQRPAISPDGSQIAFESNRNGFPEIWLTTLATGESVSLTSLRSQAGSPSWSPDGRWVVFDGRVKNSSSLFRVAPTGGEPQPITSSPTGNNLLPAVSPDGRWVYFSSSRSGHFQIWRIPFGGGEAVKQTENDGVAPQLSSDGRYLFYLDRLWAPGELWRKDLVTGKTLLVAGQVFFRGYAVGRNFVLFTRLNAGKLSLFSAAFDGSHLASVATMPSSTVGGFSLTKKEDALYFGQLDSSGDEIMLVNNF